MSYDNTDIREYSWGAGEAFGVTSILHYIVGPKGKVGFVRDISVDLTVASSTTGASVPEIDVGIASGDSTYGRYRLGTTGTSGGGYAIGIWSASNEVITGFPPRNLQDYAGHVQLDGYPLGNVGIAGGTFLTVAPLGRIPASGQQVSNVVNGTGNVWRLTLVSPLPYNLAVGQLVNVRGVSGVTGGAANGIQLTAISALNVAGNWIELTAVTFGGAYTGGGIVDFVSVVTEKQGSATATATGSIRVIIEWIGANSP